MRLLAARQPTGHQCQAKAGRRSNFGKLIVVVCGPLTSPLATAVRQLKSNISQQTYDIYVYMCLARQLTYAISGGRRMVLRFGVGSAAGRKSNEIK